jgi:murein DD-endopeptidase MepM/ murein hydrolase activator NlpD
MKKFWVSLSVILFLVLALPTQADELSDIQAKIADAQAKQQTLQDEEKQLQTQIDAAEAKGNTLSSTIKVLQATKTKIDASLRATQNSITTDNLTIQKLSLTITQKETQVDDHSAAIAKSLRLLADYDNDSLITRMLADGNLSQAWQDEVNLNNLQANLQGEIASLKVDEVDLAKQKTQKVATKNELTGLQNQLTGQKQSVQQTQDAQTALLTQTKSQEASYQALLVQKQAEEAQFEQQLFDYQEELKGPTTAAPPAKHGLLSFPLTTIKITQQFGKTADSGRLYASGTHSGTDFGTPVGSPVMAVGNGEVVGMGNTDDEKGCYSYGRWLFISYNNGLSTIYGHLSSIIVKTGDQVTVGQVVAYSGGIPGAYGSGYSTGPHVHVGLFNTSGVSIQQYTSSINCKNVSIPLANPSDYLDPLAYMPAL